MHGPKNQPQQTRDFKDKSWYALTTTNLPKFLMWEPSQATLDIDLTWKRLVLMALRHIYFQGYVQCGGKGTAPGCAHMVGAQRYQAMPLTNNIELWHGWDPHVPHRNHLRRWFGIGDPAQSCILSLFQASTFSMRGASGHN